jgi:hypothetical protein
MSMVDSSPERVRAEKFIAAQEREINACSRVLDAVEDILKNHSDLLGKRERRGFVSGLSQLQIRLETEIADLEDIET